MYTTNGMSNSNQFGHQVPITVGPDFTIPGQQREYFNTESSSDYQQGSHPGLFGENQFKGGFGPVYAVPSYPWKQGQIPHTGTNPAHQNHEQMMGGGHWQQVGGSQHAMPVYYMYPYCLCPSPYMHRQCPGNHQ
jgi:hypothetical protein